MDSLEKTFYKLCGWLLCAGVFIGLMSLLEYSIGSKVIGENGKNAVYFVAMFVIFRWFARWDLRAMLKISERKVDFFKEKQKNTEEALEMMRSKFAKGGKIEPQEEEDCLVEIIEEDEKK